LPVLNNKTNGMSKIKNMDDLSTEELNLELISGAKFVIFQYCISLLIITFNRNSDVYFIRSGESTLKHGIGFTIISFLLGWWGLPWGPIYTIGTIHTNFNGGKNVTEDVLQTIKIS
jgi:hypothetical protein